MTAVTSEATETDEAVSVAAPPIVAGASNASEFAVTLSLSVTVALAVLKMALLLSAHVAAASAFIHTLASLQFAAAPPFQAKS